MRALHTPGHRPEHTAFVLIDTVRGEEPWAVLSGDSLFVGDVARTDLAIDAVDGARQIFRSVHERLLALPDETEVWPAHLGGSMCGGSGMNLKICSTIGYERRHNPTLEISDEEEFVRGAVAKLGPQPPNFERIVSLNSGPLVTTGVEAPALYAHQVELKRGEGALLVDVRTDLQFDDVHIEGSVCIPSFSPGFGSKLAWLADHDREVVFIGRDDADGRRAARLALAVGVRNVGGLLAGGMTNWRQEGNASGHTERLAAAELPTRMQADPDLQLLDVRDREEWDEGHVPGSVWRAWHDIGAVPEGLDPARPVAVACAAGRRSATAASLLKLHGASARRSTSWTAASRRWRGSAWRSSASPAGATSDRSGRRRARRPRDGSSLAAVLGRSVERPDSQRRRQLPRQLDDVGPFHRGAAQAGEALHRGEPVAAELAAARGLAEVGGGEVAALEPHRLQPCFGEARLDERRSPRR